MAGDRSQLINFIQKFLGTVKFGNDHVAKRMGYGDYQIRNVTISQKFLGTVKFGNDHVAKRMGYGDYQIRNVTISQVYYVEGLGHNL
nr:integrase, catalytic region, zinc finger, CCHC-type, peptidase aspartic, catalytic [Tanacetum cinerariifolium]